MSMPEYRMIIVPARTPIVVPFSLVALPLKRENLRPSSAWARFSKAEYSRPATISGLGHVCTDTELDGQARAAAGTNALGSTNATTGGLMSVLAFKVLCPVPG